MVDVDAIDDTFVRVVDSSGLSWLEQVEGDDFAAGDDFCWFHDYFCFSVLLFVCIQTICLELFTIWILSKNYKFDQANLS